MPRASPCVQLRVMGGVMLWVGAAWRRGRAGMIVVMLLCGLAGAVILTVTAGARRASTSVDRMVASTNAADVLVNVTEADPTLRRQIAELPMVAKSGELAVVYALIDGVDQDVSLFFPTDARAGAIIEHDRIVRGRRPDPQRGDEVTVNESAVAVIGADVGDRIEVGTLTPEQMANEDYFPPRGPSLDLHVVGVTRGADDLIDGGDAVLVGTRALEGQVVGLADVYARYMGIQLRPGATAATFDESLRTDIPGTTELGTMSLEVRTKSARDAIDTLAFGLIVFVLVATVASVVVVGLAVGRHIASAATEQYTLDALGMPRSARVAGLTLLALPIAIGGATLAVIGAVLASPLMPIGLARRAEPDPGIDVDWWVVIVGFVVIAATVLGFAVLTGWRLVRTASAAATTTPPSVPRLLASRLGASPPAATGVQLALDRRPPAIAGKSALSGVTLAVLVVTGIFTYSASLDRLLTSPARWGYAWQLKLSFTSDDVDRAAAEIADDATLADVARWDSGFSLVDGSGVRAFGLTPRRGQPGYALRSGRQPAAVDEVVLGPTTAAALSVEPGDSVQVAADSTKAPASVRVVGIALFPEIDEGDLTDGVGFFGSGFADNATIADLFEAFKVVVSPAPGNDIDDVAAALAARYPDAVSDESAPSRPAGVANLSGVRRVPAAIAVFVAVIGLVSLAHVLASTARRRRRDLATLRCLGLTPRQTGACVVWQSLTIGAIGLVVGIPLGVVVGRLAWFATTNPIGVKPDIDRPIVAVLTLCAVTLAGALLIATPIAWRAGRAMPARALRAE